MTDRTELAQATPSTAATPVAGDAASANTMPDSSPLAPILTEPAPLPPLGFDLQPAIELVVKGGPVVALLLVLSIVATTVILVKVALFCWRGVGSARQTERALHMWLSGDRDSALTYAVASRQPAVRVLAHAMRGALGGVDERIVREDVERIALHEIADLRSHLRILDIAVQTAPLLGLFGTVLGMIDAFKALQSAGSDADPTVLAGGIWVALLTTAVGLAVAIPIAYVNAWLEGRVEHETLRMESAVTSLFTARATQMQPVLARGPVEPRFANAAE